MPPRFLFITGCPRSGTTALWRVLTADPRIVMGNEWFAGRASDLSRSMFEKARFFAPQLGADCGYDPSTHPETKDYLPLARERYDRAVFIGDKIPYLYKNLDAFAARFQGAYVVFMLRDVFEVAASYKRRQANPDDVDWIAGGAAEAIADWNASLDALTRIPPGVRVIPVHHSRIFGQGRSHPLIETLIELRRGSGTITEALAREHESYAAITARPRVLSADEIGQISNAADLETYAQVCAAHVRVGFGLLPSVWVHRPAA